MYISLDLYYSDNSHIPKYDTNMLPKLITGISNIYTDGYNPVYVLNIDER
jgi:hypothetical protein